VKPALEYTPLVWQAEQSPVIGICPPTPAGDGVVRINDKPVNVELTVDAWQDLHDARFTTADVCFICVGQSLRANVVYTVPWQVSQAADATTGM
jgi:hypothetical protein